MSNIRRYPSDISDEEWAVIEPLIPLSKSGGVNGGRPAADYREVVNAIGYMVRTGCAWRQLPRDLPPWRTVYGYFALWQRDETLDNIHNKLRSEIRIRNGKDPNPTAAIIDAQSIKGQILLEDLPGVMMQVRE